MQLWKRNLHPRHLRRQVIGHSNILGQGSHLPLLCYADHWICGHLPNSSSVSFRLNFPWEPLCKLVPQPLPLLVFFPTSPVCTASHSTSKSPTSSVKFCLTLTPPLSHLRRWFTLCRFNVPMCPCHVEFCLFSSERHLRTRTELSLSARVTSRLDSKGQQGDDLLIKKLGCRFEKLGQDANSIETTNGKLCHVNGVGHFWGN